MIYKAHTKCRACGSADLVPVLDLGDQPLANDFRTSPEGPANRAPLKVLFCEKCTLAQLSVVVDPGVLYRNYAYTTPDGPSTRVHYQALADCFQACDAVGSTIEIGSNDGSFLAYLRERGHRPLLGIDPSENACRKANSRGLNTRAAAFDFAVARDYQNVDLIVARNVFAHVDDWVDFICGVEFLCHENTLVAIEVPLASKLLARGLWDTIYHEHLSYVTLHAIENLLDQTSLKLDHVRHYPVHGGTSLLLLRKKDYCPKSIFCIGCKEKWSTPHEWGMLQQRQLRESDSLLRWLCDQGGKDVCGYTAPAKATVILNTVPEVSRKDIPWISDCTPEKIGRLLPGTDIPILPEDSFVDGAPKNAILFAWNYREEIEARHSWFTARGGKFIDPHTPYAGDIDQPNSKRIEQVRSSG